MILEKLKETLISLQSAISEADAATIKESLYTLDSISKEHGAELDPQLRHYLQRRSYEKALMFLEGESDIPKGICGGKGGE